VNSINPDTGMPEFFLKKIFKGVKKGVSKLAKGVSKALKGVTSIIKKAAPVIIPFALNAAFPGLGAIYSGALGSGIGTLIQGGSLKDAFKNALIGGAIGGATAGVQGAMGAKAAGKTISQGAFDEIAKQASFSNLQTAGQQLVSGQFGQAGYEKVLADQALVTPASETLASVKEGVTTPTDTVASATDVAASPADVAANDPFGAKRLRVAQKGTPTEFIQSPDATYSYSAEKLATTPPEFMATTTAPATTTTPTQFIEPPKAPGFFESLQDAVTPGGQGPLDSLKDAFLPSSGPTPTDVLKANNINPLNATSAQIEAAKEVAKGAATGLTRTYLPGATLAGAGLYAGGAFDKPDEDDDTDEEMDRLTGPNQYYLDNKDRFLLSGYTPQYATGPVKVATTYTQGLGQYEDGGGVFPRRVGGIMPDEGTPGKDSVKAMLMPGEFVMTTNAVKGLGDGDNNKGINRMYDMMRGLEAKGKAMA